MTFEKKTKEQLVYIYKNRHGNEVKLDYKTAMNHGETLKAVNDNAKNIEYRPRNAQGEMIIKDKV